MDTISITLHDVSRSASVIRSQNQQMDRCLQEINSIMNQLSSTWQSPAAETLRARFRALLPVFDDYKRVVESYALFLDQTVESYQQMELQLNKQADVF